MRTPAKYSSSDRASMATSGSEARHQERALSFYVQEPEAERKSLLRVGLTTNISGLWQARTIQSLVRWVAGEKTQLQG